MMRSILIGTALSLFATPALAVTYDAFTSFDGNQMSGGFVYGETTSALPGAGYVLFGVNTNCAVAGSTCLQLLPNDVPLVSKSTMPSFQFTSVNVPTDRLLAHPANDDGVTFIAFVAPTASRYRYTATFNVQDVSPSGVGIDRINQAGVNGPLSFTSLGSINAGSPTFTTSGQLTLGTGEAFAVGIDRAGSYNNDSTGVNFTVSSFVPEPAQWALMFGGLGLIGAASRRRRSNTVFA